MVLKVPTIMLNAREGEEVVTKLNGDDSLVVLSNNDNIGPPSSLVEPIPHPIVRPHALPIPRR